MRTITAQVAPCSVGTGLAFDGTNLLLSCWDADTIEVVSSTDGHLIATHHISALSSIGALAWDPANRQLWACNLNNDGVYTIDLSNDSATFKFTSDGCTDGLSLDLSDNTIWASADAASTLQHFRLTGSLIASFDISGSLGGCGNSGIAVGGSSLFLSNDGCFQIYETPKSNPGDPARTVLIGQYTARLEDLECDDTSFSNTTAIWSKDAYDSVLNAWDAGKVDCGTSAYRDSDGDGIPDSVEENGLDVNGDGKIDVNLKAMGADPLHKDLFVEGDYYFIPGKKIGPIHWGDKSYQPAPDVVKRVEDAFNDIPVDNPDGTTGIHLHFDAGPKTVMNPATGETWGSLSTSDAVIGESSPKDWSTFKPLASIISTHADKNRSDVPFHYVLFADHLGNGNGGTVTGNSLTIPSKELIVAAADVGGVEESVTLAHELGHNIGLGHGGRERTDYPELKCTNGVPDYACENKKANYLSIMNYLYSSGGLISNEKVGPFGLGGYKSGIIRFSPYELKSLYTTQLDENTGLSIPSPDPFGHLRIKYLCPDGKLANGGNTVDSYGPIDWDCNGKIESNVMNVNLESPPPSNPINPVLSSDDTVPGALKFWGEGASWDARDEQNLGVSIDNLSEPTIQELKNDGVFWPNPTLISSDVGVVAIAPNIGKVALPIEVSNPNTTQFDVTGSITDGSDIATIQENNPISFESLETQTLHIVVRTDELTPGVDRSIHITFANSDAGTVGDAVIELEVINESTPSPATCDAAKGIVGDPTASPAAVAAARAILATCKPPDTTPPRSTIARSPSIPSGADGWYTQRVRVTVTASDPDDPVAETRCVLDPHTAPATFDAIPPGCSFMGDGAYVRTYGRHAVYAASKDSNDNVETTVRKVTFKIDTTAPAISIAFPQHGSYNATHWAHGCPTPGFCGKATDPDSSVKSVAYSLKWQGSGLYWDGVAFRSSTPVLLTAQGRKAWSVPFPFAHFHESFWYTLTVTAADDAGNAGSSRVTFQVLP
ncbi:MAG TPA: Ig-like domain-containing protein [Gaiellaceae bacterium]|nr:Ig-like domain-containing protein [Gaiellaceae bacterium]